MSLPQLSPPPAGGLPPSEDSLRTPLPLSCSEHHSRRVLFRGLAVTVGSALFPPGEGRFSCSSEYSKPFHGSELALLFGLFRHEEGRLHLLLGLVSHIFGMSQHPLPIISMTHGGGQSMELGNPPGAVFFLTLGAVGANRYNWPPCMKTCPGIRRDQVPREGPASALSSGSTRDPACEPRD